MDFLIGLIAGAVIGYAFRGWIGREISKVGTELREEISKLKGKV